MPSPLNLLLWQLSAGDYNRRHFLAGTFPLLKFIVQVDRALSSQILPHMPDLQFVGQLVFSTDRVSI